MSEFVDDLPTSILRDWMIWTLGKKLGGGIGRSVFVYEANPRYVIKVESKAGFQNVIEWETWNAVKGTKFERWFAPCKFITGLGTILVMERTLPAPRKQYPKKMPIFLGDYKYSNYGLLRGHIVAHDYGSAICLSNGLSSKMRKAEWWDSNDGTAFDDSGKT